MPTRDELNIRELKYTLLGNIPHLCTPGIIVKFFEEKSLYDLLNQKKFVILQAVTPIRKIIV